jgi:hypothetical protein
MEWSNMNQRRTLLSAATILPILGVLFASTPASASPRGGTLDLSDQWSRQFERLAQFRTKKDPEPDPGGLPGVRPDSNSKADPDVQRGYYEREEYRKQRGLEPPSKSDAKPDRTKPDKPEK